MKPPTVKKAKRAPVAGARPTAELIFVVGPPRSGTTLLSGLLTGGDEAYGILPECALLTSALRSRLDTTTVGADPAGLKAFGVTEQRLDAQYGRLAEWFVNNAINAHLPDVRKYLILKDPSLCFILSDLHRFFQRSIRSVCLIRDPRDVVASQLLVLERLGNARSVGDACQGILPYFENLMVAVDNPNPKNPLFPLRYEDLILDEADVRPRLEAFCGYKLKYDEYYGIDAKHFDAEDPWYQDTLIGPINPNRIGNFRHKLDAEEILYVEKTFEGIMQRFDYAPSSAYRQFAHLEGQLREAETRFLAKTAELEREKQDLLDRHVTELAAAASTNKQLAEEAAKRAIEARATVDELDRVRLGQAEEQERFRGDLERLMLDLETVRQQAVAADGVRDSLQAALDRAQAQVGASEAEASRLSAELETAATAAARSDQGREALAGLEHQLTLAEQDRDLALARLATLESRFLVRAFLSPGWRTSRLSKASRRAD